MRDAVAEVGKDVGRRWTGGVQVPEPALTVPPEVDELTKEVLLVHLSSATTQSDVVARGPRHIGRLQAVLEALDARVAPPLVVRLLRDLRLRFRYI